MEYESPVGEHVRRTLNCIAAKPSLLQKIIDDVVEFVHRTSSQTPITCLFFLGDFRHDGEGRGFGASLCLLSALARDLNLPVCIYYGDTRTGQPCIIGHHPRRASLLIINDCMVAGDIVNKAARHMEEAYDARPTAVVTLYTQNSDRASIRIGDRDLPLLVVKP